MTKLIYLTIMLTVVVALAACYGDHTEDTPLEHDDHAHVTQPEYCPAPQPQEEEMPADDVPLTVEVPSVQCTPIQSEKSDELEETPIEVLLAYYGISEYSWQVATDFLSGFTSIFTGVAHRHYEWDEENRTIVPTERFMLGWNHENQQPITTYETPKLYFAPTGGAAAFFDNEGRAILDAPWASIDSFANSSWDGFDTVHIYLYAHHYASYFLLFDFDNSGMLDIIVHFQQTSLDTCYYGFYEIYRYVDGAFTLFEMHPPGWVGSGHVFFTDAEGRLIIFTNNKMIGEGYAHIVFTANRAELHFIDTPYYSWEEWEAHHWTEWESTPRGHVLVSSWRDYHPTIFGTDIALTPLNPFENLGAVLYRSFVNDEE